MRLLNNFHWFIFNIADIFITLGIILTILKNILKKMLIKKRILIFLFFLFILNNCSSLDEAGKVLRNEKTKYNDEFLVEKKQPLTMPPDFDKIPLPNSEDEDKKNSQSFKDLLTTNDILVEKRRKENLSLEEEIISKIKQN